MNFKVTVFTGLALFGVQSVWANDLGTWTVVSRELREVFVGAESQEVAGFQFYKGLNLESPVGDKVEVVDPIEELGKIISVAKDLVALGEDVYKLVVKGKPNITTKHAPISVIPKESGEAVDVMSIENWKTPLKRSFEVVYKNLYGMKVVTFRYSVIFAYGGNYNGKGAYLTAVQIIPESVSTVYGYDFTATMKLGGIQNNGSRENPIAAATLLMEYTVSTIVKASTAVDTVFVTGSGDFKKY